MHGPAKPSLEKFFGTRYWARAYSWIRRLVDQRSSDHSAMAGACDKAKRYREIAAKARADAEKVTVPQAKQVLLDVAADYERLADTLDANARRARR